MLSPLRYPGGKADFLPTIFKVFQYAGLEGLPFFEPYAGSAAIALSLVEAGIVKNATLLERDPLVYAFWKCVFEQTDDLLTQYQALPITLDTWHRLRPLLQVQEVTPQNLLPLGLAGLFFNRANFSGVMNGGPIGGMRQLSQYKIDCRTNKDDLICRILSIASLDSKFEVRFGDAIDLIKENRRKKNVAFYIDPPYFEKGELLYRHYYRHADHKKLAAALKDVNFHWILSYDPHHVIEHLYSDFAVQKHHFRYSVRSPKKHDELLISNVPLPARW